MEDDPGRRVPLLSRLAGTSRSPRVLVAVGVLALTLAVVLGVLTWLDVRGSEEKVAGPEPVATERKVFRRGGFALAVPQDMEVRRRGRTAQLVGDDPELVVDVGPASSAQLRRAHRAFLRSIDRGYAKVRLIGRERGRLNGRRSLTTAGTAVNDADVPIRFVVVTVRARPTAYTMAAYTARESAPEQVLPRVNAVVDGFEVLPR